MNEAKIKELEKELEIAKKKAPAPYFGPSAPMGTPPPPVPPALPPSTPQNETVVVSKGRQHGLQVIMRVFRS